MPRLSKPKAPRDYKKEIEAHRWIFLYGLPPQDAKTGRPIPLVKRGFINIYKVD